MIAEGLGIVLDARRRGVAIGAFTTYTLESTRAICDVADAAATPVIIQAGSSSFRGVGRDLLAAAAVTAARAARQPVGVHLDHSTDLEEILACLDLGYSSVMVDGSNEEFETNVALTAEVVRRAHARGAWVEGELGALAGDEDASMRARAGEYTNPARVAEFVERTGVDVLAVAIGSVHGISDAPVHLDLDLLAHIVAETEVPLALHGASGLDPRELASAIDLGMTKVNINTELRRAYLEAVRGGPGDDDIVAVQHAAITAVSEVVAAKVTFLSGGGGS